jgi:hypothetical protein
MSITTSAVCACTEHCRQSVSVHRPFVLLATHPQHILLSNLIIVLAALDLPNIVLELLAHANCLFQVRIVELGLAKASQLSRRRDRITDLSPVHRLLGQNLEMCLHIVEIHILLHFGQTIDEFGPDLGAPVGVEVAEVQGELDTGFESFVECTDAVAREDQDSLRLGQQCGMEALLEIVGNLPS